MRFWVFACSVVAVSLAACSSMPSVPGTGKKKAGTSPVLMAMQPGQQGRPVMRRELFFSDRAVALQGYATGLAKICSDGGTMSVNPWAGNLKYYDPEAGKVSKLEGWGEAKQPGQDKFTKDDPVFNEAMNAGAFGVFVCSYPEGDKWSVRIAPVSANMPTAKTQFKSRSVVVETEVMSDMTTERIEKYYKVSQSTSLRAIVSKDIGELTREQGYLYVSMVKPIDAVDVAFMKKPTSVLRKACNEYGGKLVATVWQDNYRVKEYGGILFGEFQCKSSDEVAWRAEVLPSNFPKGTFDTSRDFMPAAQSKAENNGAMVPITSSAYSLGNTTKLANSESRIVIKIYEGK
jgi:hypothetical protein